MKPLLILATLALISTGALAGSERCVTRILHTNYNSGLEGMESTVCHVSNDGFKAEPKCETSK